MKIFNSGEPGTLIFYSCLAARPQQDTAHSARLRNDGGFNLEEIKHFPDQ
jgi:hypothetical protein